MHDVAEGAYQVEGNREVCEFLDKWRKKAGEGKLNFVGLVACQSPTESFTDHVGVIGTEFAANFGCDNLKMQVLSSVFRRMPPEVDKGSPANRVVYNLASAPCSFDFLAWIVTCELVRIKEGAPGPLQVAFSFGADQNMERCFVTDQRKIMYDGVMKPLIAMIGAVEVKPEDKMRWPDIYTLRKATELVAGGLPFPALTPNKKAVDDVERYLSGRKPVTITLREVSSHWPHRNSNIPEWIKFADWLSGQGEDVLFVRDTAHAKEPFGAYHTLPSASLDVNARMALYERAKINLFVGNGPATMAFHTKTPWLMFAPIDPSGAYPPGRPEWWKPHHGIAVGEQFPWSLPNQRIIWEVDTFDHIRKAWCDLWDYPHRDYPNPVQPSVPAPSAQEASFVDLIAVAAPPLVPVEPSAARKVKAQRGRPSKAEQRKNLERQLRTLAKAGIKGNGKGRHASR